MRQFIGFLLVIVAVCSLAFFEPKPTVSQNIKKKEKPVIEKVEPKEENEYQNPIEIF